MSTSQAGIPFSLARGGPFYALQRRLGLSRGDEHDSRRLALALALASWGPLALLAIVERLTTGDASPLFRDPSVHVRLLVAVPLFIWAVHLLDHRCRVTVDELAESGIADGDVVWRTITSANRLRDSWVPELLVLAAALLSSQLALWGAAPSTGLLQSFTTERWLPIRLWYGLVALPLFQVVLARSIWRWAIWARFLWQLSRHRLRLVPSHPDLAGGIAFLARPTVGFLPVVVASGAVVSSAWAGGILRGQIQLAQLATPFAVFLLFAELVALGPLLFFSGRLLEARLEGLRAYAELALRYTRRFHQRWISEGESNDEKLLGAPDIQSLADLGTSFDVVERMRFVLVDSRHLYFVFVAAVVPMLPIFLTKMSLWQIVELVGHALIGGGGH